MPVTEAQAARIAAYYEARKPYNKLLYEALDRASVNTSDAEEETTGDMKQERTGEAQPQPGAHFTELVELLKESKIPNVDGEKKANKRKL